ncbi:MAG TPA: menaquinone biosynthesis protein [Gemmatimonadaceae bacterium]|nr:menaquinone biosynthesis protein [Gemmatimonadaceae bacterium]
MTLTIGRIPYINCYPVYGAIDRGLIRIDADLVDGVPTALNALMAAGKLDVSVVSAVEYARDSRRYLLLPDLAISCDGPVRSVMLFSKRPATELSQRRVLVSRSSMTSVALLELLFDNVWHAHPLFVPTDAEISDVARFGTEEHEARLVIGDAALLLESSSAAEAHRADKWSQLAAIPDYPYAYDLGDEWKRWTGLPFVFAVWVAQRNVAVDAALAAHAGLIASRDWGIANVRTLARQASQATGVTVGACEEYLEGLDYGLSYPHLAGLTEFYRRLVERGSVPNGTLTFLPAA